MLQSSTMLAQACNFKLSFRTVVQHLRRFQLTSRRAVPLAFAITERLVKREILCEPEKFCTRDLILCCIITTNDGLLYWIWETFF